MAMFQTLREGVTSLLMKKIKLRGHTYVLYFRYIRRPLPSHLLPNFQEKKALDTRYNRVQWWPFLDWSKWKKLIRGGRVRVVNSLPSFICRRQALIAEPTRQWRGGQVTSGRSREAVSYVDVVQTWDKKLNQTPQLNSLSQWNGTYISISYHCVTLTISLAAKPRARARWKASPTPKQQALKLFPRSREMQKEWHVNFYVGLFSSPNHSLPLPDD